MMKHEKAMQLLADYAVGRLKGRAKIALEQHISECPICERELKALQQTEKLLREVGLVRPSNPKLMLTRIRSATAQSPRVQSKAWQWRTFGVTFGSQQLDLLCWLWWLQRLFPFGVNLPTDLN